MFHPPIRSVGDRHPLIPALPLKRRAGVPLLLSLTRGKACAEKVLTFHHRFLGKKGVHAKIWVKVDKIASQASFIQLFGSISRLDPNTNLWQSWNNQAVTCVKQVVIVLMAPITEDRTCHSLEVWRTSTDPILLSFFVAFGNNLLLQCDKCSPHHYFQSFNLSLPARAVWKTSV